MPEPSQDINEALIESMESVARYLVENSVSMDAEIAQIVADEFWNMYGPVNA